MTLKELLDIANTGYPDGYLSEYYGPTGKLRHDGQGDSLARFIVAEIIDTFDADASDEVQLQEASRVLQAGIADMQGVINMLWQSPLNRCNALTDPLDDDRDQTNPVESADWDTVFSRPDYDADHDHSMDH